MRRSSRRPGERHQHKKTVAACSVYLRIALPNVVEVHELQRFADRDTYLNEQRVRQGQTLRDLTAHSWQAVWWAIRGSAAKGFYKRRTKFISHPHPYHTGTLSKGKEKLKVALYVFFSLSKACSSPRHGTFWRHLEGWGVSFCLRCVCYPMRMYVKKAALDYLLWKPKYPEPS